QVLGEDVGELALPAQRDELECGEPLGVIVAAAAFAQGVVEGADVFEDAELEVVVQRIVKADDAREAASGLALDEGGQCGLLLLDVAQAQGLQEDLVGGLVVAGDQGLNELL